MTAYGLYIHFPFCLSKCPYCDFKSRPCPTPIDYDEWKSAYFSSLLHFDYRLQDKKPLKTIFFGGGTPSLMPVSMIGDMIEKAYKIWGFSSDIEISIEVNPRTSSRSFLEGIRSAGVNRVSIGVQSFDEQALKFLGRPHDLSVTTDTIIQATSLFSRVSLDLIYARPGQTLKEWEQDLKKALSFDVRHLSLYQLTIEKGSKFYTENVKLPDEETSVAMYRLTDDIVREKGLEKYEISNYAVPGEECRHNLLYWTGGPFIGVGPAAHGRLFLFNRHIETQNTDDPFEWKDKLTYKEKVLSDEEYAIERFLMEIRLTRGIDIRRFETDTRTKLFPWFGKSFLNQTAFKELKKEELVKKENGHLKATPEGLLLLDTVTEKLLS